MRSLRSICALLAVLAIASFAHADTISTYNFSNTTLTENKGDSFYGTVSGQITIDLTTGKTVSGDFTATYGASSPFGTPTNTFNFTDISSATKLTGSNPKYNLTVFEDTTNSIFFNLEYVIKGDTVILCTRSTNGANGNGACNQGSSGQQSSLASRTVFNTSDEDLVAGSLDPIAATPEPSSFILLGSGLLGAVGAARRRFARS